MVKTQKNFVIVALSGGVDSAIAAYLLKKAGHHVEAIFMKNWEADELCPAAEDFADAVKVCEKLKISLDLVNFSDQYWTNVFQFFLSEHQAGRTPNPDVLCNREIKFKAFLDQAKLRGADFIATGHYARREDQDRQYELLKGVDLNKDQSYFLHRLNQAQIRHSLFPIGHLTKNQVRILAKDINLPNYAKKDSTGICFIGERRSKSFLSHYLPDRPGSIETLLGEIIGRHDGLMFYTIGQRKGLQIGGISGKSEAPWYVVDKNLPRNALIVAQGNMHAALYRETLTVQDLHWINDQPKNVKLSAKIRYRQMDQLCRIQHLHDQTYHVIFDQPQRAVTPGQSIVFYQHEKCLGGGMIVA